MLTDCPEPNQEQQYPRYLFCKSTIINFVEFCEVIPGVSDHEVVLVTSLTSISHSKPRSRKSPYGTKQTLKLSTIT